MNSNISIIFDMDGVLINSEPLHFAFEEILFESMGIDISRTEHETFVGTTNRTMWEIISRNHRLPVTIPEIMVKGEREFLLFLKEREPITLIPGVRNLLNQLKNKGYTVALASSSPLSLINYILRECKIENYFTVIMSGNDVDKGKPDPEIFLKTANKTGNKPKNCLVIEDSENGVKAAVGAGMKCMGYRNPDSGNQDLSSADFIFDSFNKLSVDQIEKLFVD